MAQPDPLTAHDHRKRRCPMLGHEIAFAYCRHPGSEMPCRRILDCWWEIFDVAGFARQQFTPEQLDAVAAPRRDKAATLVDLIQQVRQRTGQ